MFGTIGKFSPVHFCTDTGHRKPDPMPYRHMLDALQLKPEECLYIDNREENIKTAKDMGMHVVLAKNTTATVVDIKQLTD